MSACKVFSPSSSANSAPIDQALQTLSCTALSLDELEQATSTAPYLTLSSGYGRLRLEQKGDAALLTLESDSVNAPQMAVQLADNQLWQAVEQSLNGAAQHPSWLYKLIDAPSVRVSFQRQTGVEDFPAVTDTSRSPYVQKMLGDITVRYRRRRSWCRAGRRRAGCSRPAPRRGR